MDNTNLLILKQRILKQSDMENSQFIEDFDVDRVVASVDGTVSGEITIATNTLFSIGDFVIVESNVVASVRGYITSISGTGPYVLTIKDKRFGGTVLDLSLYLVSEAATVYDTTTSELTQMIQSSIEDFYDLLIEAWGNDYVFEEYSFSTTPNVKDYALPDDYYKFVGLDYVDSSGRVYPCKRFLFREREKYNNQSSGNNQGYNLRYRLLGNNIRLLPMPTSAFTMLLYYIPVPTVPIKNTDSFDFIQGWEDFVVWDCVIKCLSKEESDVTVAMTERNKVEEKIMKMRENRDANEADRVLNLYDTQVRYPDSSTPPNEYDGR